MAKGTSNGNSHRSLVVLTGTVLTVVIVGCLFWAQAIFIPLTLAAYLAFLLSPPVNFLQRRRIGRVLSVVVVVSAGALVLGSIAWMVGHEFSSLVQELPKYKGTIQRKVQSLRQAGEATPLRALGQMIREIEGEPESQPAGPNEKPPATSSDGTGTPRPSSPPSGGIAPSAMPWLSRLPSFLSSLAELLTTLALTLVLVIFMLLNREDLRNRMIRLLGHGQIALTTKALDDTAQRLSRFLLIQALSNAAFGLALAIGLFVIGIPYAFLWGFLAAVLRYLPYVGTWIAAIFPLTLSVATSESWMSPLMVLALFGVIELFYSNLVEPRIFGQSMGVSEVALLVAAAFWAFLWGPIGLVLSNPITVFLVVLGKYFPQLEFFTVLMGDEPALAPNVSFYQRLLARDRAEAMELVRAHARSAPAEEVYDSILIPALTFAQRDLERDEVTEEDQQYILKAIAEIIEEIGKQHSIDLAKENSPPLSNGQPADMPKVRVFCCPVRDATDELALEMFRQLLDPARWEIDVASTEMLSAEMVARAEREQPALICLSALPPGGLSQTRYLCRRLRAKLPTARILIGRWGLTSNLEQNQEQLREAGADEVDATLLATRKFLRARYPLLAQGIKDSVAAGSAQ
jgi:predicted PurR-regulated permease PerM